MLLVAPVMEVLVHRRVLLVQREREALVHGVVRGDAVGDGVGSAEQDVAFHLMNHSNGS